MFRLDCIVWDTVFGVAEFTWAEGSVTLVVWESELSAVTKPYMEAPSVLFLFCVVFWVGGLLLCGVFVSCFASVLESRILRAV